MSEDELLGSYADFVRNYEGYWMSEYNKLLSGFLRILDKYITWTASDYYLKREFKEDKDKWKKRVE